MVRSLGLSALLRLGAVLPLLSHVTCLDLTVSTSGGNATNPIMWGFMFEDINHSGDGGIHGQLLRNNGFQGEYHNTTAYAAVGDVDISVDDENPLSDALPYSLAVSVPEGTTGSVGFSNEGYWGITVNADVYSSYFWVKGGYSGDVAIKLVGAASGTEYASSTVAVDSTDDKYTYFETSFESKQAPDGNNLWTLTFDAEKVAGSALHFDLVQLFPTTFHERANGLKPAIANVVDDMGGKFLRFPGGNNLEGASAERRWKWNNTIGPLENRPGRQGDWGYGNSDALGLVEYLFWCDDMGLEPILGVWAGYSLESGGNTPITGDALQPYIDDVLNELEFITGDTSTTYGKLRESYGYAEPWTLKYVEIGNEDNLGGGCESYAERFTAFHDAIHAAYPDLTIIASTNEASCLPSSMPAGAWADYHNYNTAASLVASFNQFDHADRATPLFIGEFSCRETATSKYPFMRGSVAEAVYMLGFERNADVVRLAAYAPLLQLFNDTQWDVDLIGFTQEPGNVVRSTSYFVQQLFAQNSGTTTREVSADAAFGPVYWSATASADGKTTYLKLANYGDAEQSVSVRVEGATKAALTTLSADELKSNSPDEGEVVVPVKGSVQASNGSFALELPAWAVAVLVVS
ncbi:glycoside hydrolase family 51 protein [Aplosporella prunicola CBS 121167]|uniref:non-reducing end alpha-L-arabinofuranosidase n=1 Tax=Aplosporella prunicola CBS 121167 TaxID=1176127 RepID=A0A6A6BMK0_9PEZI|nr:glycoside hydrolase family 51 protein [Aplosporella prunicola CBS 121167]KAF2145286.1 glycoside hydrolase family 51 protein [Aplosporella prunicola CBS 121167]